MHDDEEHHVTFIDSKSVNWHTLEGDNFLQGELINVDTSAGPLMADVRDRFERNDLREIDQDFVTELRGKLLSILGMDSVEGTPRLAPDMPSLVEGLRDIRYLLTAFFGVEMVILRRGQ